MSRLIFSIQKMTPRFPDYFTYLPSLPETAQWGVGVRAAGRTSIRPGMGYPPAKHPGGHHFQWEHGRVLEALQVVLISEGGGAFETAEVGRRRIRAGMVFLLFPGVWHRYQPDISSGWTESWIEVEGPVVDALIRGGTLTPRAPLHSRGDACGLEEALDEVHRQVRVQPWFPPALSAAAHRVLALTAEAAQKDAPPSRIREAIGRAERYLAEHHADPIKMDEVAARLGVGYSHFRRAFRARSGLSPWQYVLRIRLTHARRLLASNNATLDDIAAAVGFSSAFHLSHAFKRAYGISPDQWRKRR